MALDEETLWVAYVRLWGRCEGRGLRVRYSGPLDGEAGCFVEGEQRIYLVREAAGENPSAPQRFLVSGEPADLRAEFATLAHEQGHARSYEAEKHTAAYVAARARVAAHRSPETRGAPLTPEECALVLDEEHRAWDAAEKEARALGGWQLVQIVQEARVRSLAVYAEIFAL